MIKKIALAAALLSSSSMAGAVVVNFDGVPINGGTIPGGYVEDGVTVTNAANYFWGYPSGSQLHLDTGWTNDDYSFTFAGGAFDLQSFDITDTAGNGLLEGFDASNNLIASLAFSASTTGTRNFTTFNGVSRVRLKSTSGHFSIDNFTIAAATGAVPEPSTWALLILGFGAVGGAMRRRTAVATRTRAALNFA